LASLVADDEESEEAPEEDSDEGEESAEESTEETTEESADDGATVAETKPVLRARRQPVAGKPGMGKGSFTRFMMIFLFLLAIVAIFDQQMALGFGAIAGLVLYPVIGFGGRFPVLTVLLAGALTTTVSSILRDHYTDWVRMVKFQKVNGAWQREYREAMRKGNKSHIEKLNKVRQGFTKDQMDIQLNSMKPLAWTFFLFIVLFAWLNVFVNQDLLIFGGQYFAVPWASNVYVDYVPFLFPSWILMYSLLAIPIGQILTRVLKYVRFKRKLDAMGVSVRPEGAT
jgi:uncharacterized membrane protein (DUF106 family)